MAEYELKEGKFSLFRNEQKSKDKSPDYTGKGMFEGVEVRLSGWVAKSDSGKVYIQGSIKRPQPSQPPATQQEADSFLGPLLDESIPAPERPTRSQQETEEQSSDLPF